MNNKTNKPVKILLWNANSIFKRIKELRLVVARDRHDLVIIVETKIKTEGFPPRVSGYDSMYKSRDSRGGGVLIYYKRKHLATQIETGTNSIESCAIKIGDLTIAAAYNPAQLDIENINQLISLDEQVAVIGDFNARSTVWGDSKTNANGSKLLNACDKYDKVLGYRSKHTRHCHHQKYQYVCYPSTG